MILGWSPITSLLHFTITRRHLHYIVKTSYIISCFGSWIINLTELYFCITLPLAVLDSLLLWWQFHNTEVSLSSFMAFAFAVCQSINSSFPFVYFKNYSFDTIWVVQRVTSRTQFLCTKDRTGVPRICTQDFSGIIFHVYHRSYLIHNL